MSEAETRAELIDPAIREAGWGVVDGSRVLRERNCAINPSDPEAIYQRKLDALAELKQSPLQKAFAGEL